MPQWNCSCPGCDLARSGQTTPQLQSSIAISGDGQEWWLIDVSPDLATQIASFRPLQPTAAEPQRHSPISGVLLTNSGIANALGILLMRARETPLPVYTSGEIREKLRWVDELMKSFCGIDWRDLPPQFSKLADGVGFRGAELPRSVAFQLRANRNQRLVVAPAVSAISGELHDAINEADAFFFDGTIWSNDEPQRTRSGLEMPHMPIERSLPLLSESPARRKIYTHLNHTNPILRSGSRERRIVEAAGVIVGYDGLEFEL